MKDMENWIDSIFANSLPEEIIAIAFNLYEEGDNQWSVEMVGSGSFDAENPDWACDEVFYTRDNLQSWMQNAVWEEILQEVTDKIKKYLETGKYAEQIKSYAGVGVGFVDGDITIVYQNNSIGITNKRDVSNEKQRHRCKCCGYYTLVGTVDDIDWDICPVCFWENDVFGENPEAYSGANHMTLAQGRENYKNYSACDPKSLLHVRLPLPQELPENNE